MRFAAQHTVSVDVLTAQLVSSPYDAFPVEDWTTPTTRRLDDILVYAGVGAETPTAGAPYRLTDELTAILPYGDPITRLDRVDVLSGPYKGTYGVSARPAHWLTPWTGWAGGTQVQLKEVVGG